MDLTASRLHEGIVTSIRQLQNKGFVLHNEPNCGKYLWVRHTEFASSDSLASQARGAGLLIAPGRVFRPNQQDTPWFRVNVAQTSQPQWSAWLNQLC
jgi:DNA-binding transcriptional MocR family regulator